MIETALVAISITSFAPITTPPKMPSNSSKRTQRGRATFLPLASLRPSYLNDRTLDVLHDKRSALPMNSSNVREK